MSDDALWTRFVRNWRNLRWAWCATCRAPVDPTLPMHYHGDYFD